MVISKAFFVYYPRNNISNLNQRLKYLPLFLKFSGVILYMVLPYTKNRGFPGGSEVKASACNAGDLGLIPGSGRSPGERNGTPLQYSCLENPMDGGAWWATVHRVAKSRTWLSDFTFTFLFSTTRETALHGDITRWSIPKSDWLYYLQPKVEMLYPVSKNKTRNWLWLRSWTPYCQIQT